MYMADIFSPNFETDYLSLGCMGALAAQVSLLPLEMNRYSRDLKPGLVKIYLP